MTVLKLHEISCFSSIVILICFASQVLSAVLSEAGFDGKSLIASAQDQRVKDQLRKNTERCETHIFQNSNHPLFEGYVLSL